MFCKNCGAELPDGAIFCAACGESLQGGSPQRAKEASAVSGTVEAAVPATSGGKSSAGKAVAIVVAILVAIALLLTQFHICDYCGQPFFGKSYRAYGYDFLCTDCGSRNAPFVVENDFLTI